MFLPKDIIDQINNLTGAMIQPYTLWIDGRAIETNCYAWEMPPQVSSEANPSRFNIPKDVQELLMKISDQAAEEQNQMGGEFNFDLYTQRIREISLELPEEIQAKFRKTSHITDDMFQHANNPQDRHLEIFDSVRILLLDSPVFAYKSEISWAGPTSNTFRFIVVAPTTNQFELLRIERTDGANYGLSTEDIILKMKDLDLKVGIDIQGVTSDGVEFKLQRMPKGAKLTDLEKWLLDLCPDLYQSQENILADTIFLWWD